MGDSLFSPQRHFLECLPQIDRAIVNEKFSMSLSDNTGMEQVARELLPNQPVGRWLAPVHRFLHIEAASGFVLLAATVIALGLANSPWSHAFAELWETEIRFVVGNFTLAGSLGHLIISDGLMTIFFFVIGLEIKREIVGGELSNVRNAILPIAGAIGGMVAPALIYLAFQWGNPESRGWAIPMATDIAFVVGIMALFGRRVPIGLKIFLLTLAIVDDLGAVLIIAFVYSDAILWNWMAWALAGFALTYFANRIGVRYIPFYVILGTCIWISFLWAGVHTTVAGVILGLMTPARAWIPEKTFVEVLGRIFSRDENSPATPTERKGLKLLRFTAKETISPLDRLIEKLHPWVAFLIMPLFALANAGVALEAEWLTHPVSLSVAAGLAIGKPVGILLCAVLIVATGLAPLPRAVSWPMFAGGACLAGIGFTMALFLNALAFSGPEFIIANQAGKIGTLLGSIISAVLGISLLLFGVWGKKSPAPDPLQG